jgi:hypothetical protein
MGLDGASTLYGTRWCFYLVWNSMVLLPCMELDGASTFMELDGASTFMELDGASTLY